MTGGLENRTTIGFKRDQGQIVQDARIHYIEVVDGVDRGRRYMVGPTGAVIGRVPPADFVLEDSRVSRAHCRLTLIGDKLYVTDLGSTNGTFLDDVRVYDPTVAPVGSILRVGQQVLRYESRNESEISQNEELSRDLDIASAYIRALLPAPVDSGPMRCDWVYLPSTKLGGDGFGYGALGDGVYIAYLIDVSGHGAGAAMHAVSVLNVLGRRALPGVDFRAPDQVLSALNAMFPMESSGEMYFTMWYGVYEPASRTLIYASAGHHASYLVDRVGGGVQPLRTRNPVIGAVPGARFSVDTVTSPAGASLYVFSDGVFEIVTREGVQWGLSDFVDHLQKPPVDGQAESRRLLETVQSIARPPGFEDDFSLVVFTFD